MPSLRAKFVNRVIRTTVKSVPLYDMTPDQVRGVFRRRVLPWVPSGITREVIKTPIAGEWHRVDKMNQNHKSKNAILYCHGGGYVFGSPKSHRCLTYALAKQANADVFSLDYRLAPEHPCPAAIEDTLAAYSHLLDEGYAPDQITFAGDSAGAGLVLTTLQALKQQAHTLPASAVLYSPYTDLAVEGASITSNARSDVMFKEQTIRSAGQHYAGSMDAKDPRLSPLYGSMEGLPPLLVFVSTTEALYNDSTRLVEKAQASGVDVTFIEKHGLVHVWPVFYPLMPEAEESITQSATFMKQHFG